MSYFAVILIEASKQGDVICTLAKPTFSGFMDRSVADSKTGEPLAIFDDYRTAYDCFVKYGERGNKYLLVRADKFMPPPDKTIVNIYAPQWERV